MNHVKEVAGWVGSYTNFYQGLNTQARARLINEINYHDLNLSKVNFLSAINKRRLKPQKIAKSRTKITQKYQKSGGR